MSAAKRNWPYLIHTNRELGLMLRGEKPLARFSRQLRPTVPVLERYLRLFDRHVEEGTFIKHITGSDPARRVERVYYALPGQEWRIAEMDALLDGKTPWTLACERREGELLGYTDSQNDFWIAYCRERIGAS